MGYTGKKAMHFKVAYINAFNMMEAQLSQPQNYNDAYLGAVAAVCEAVTHKYATGQQHNIKELQIVANLMPQKRQKAAPAKNPIVAIDDNGETWLTAKQVADLMNISPRAIRQNIHQYVHKMSKGKGGMGYVIELSSLPLDVQLAYYKDRN
jgi:phage regulator Rha-like protein